VRIKPHEGPSFPCSEKGECRQLCVGLDWGDQMTEHPLHRGGCVGDYHAQKSWKKEEGCLSVCDRVRERKEVASFLGKPTMLAHATPFFTSTWNDF